MKRKFKTLGIVLAAVFAISVIGASAASAASTFHTNGAVPTTITGSQTTSHVFTTSAGTVTCSVATFHGTASFKTDIWQTLTPHYTGCKAFGFINVPVDTFSCSFLFQANGVSNLNCGPLFPIEITAPGCTTKIASQQIASGMTYTNGLSDITAHTNMSGIKYDECGTVRTNGTYKGTTTLSTANGSFFVS